VPAVAIAAAAGDPEGPEGTEVVLEPGDEVELEPGEDAPLPAERMNGAVAV